MIYEVSGKKPQLGKNCFVAPNAAVMGDVTLCDGATVWFGVTIRAENDTIYIGKNSNVQDGSVLHVDPGKPLVIEENVTVGHKAMLHGCHIGAGSLVGINAVVLNGAVIGKGCLVGANALVTENTLIPDGSMAFGSPAKIVKTLDKETRQQLLKGAEKYTENGQMFRETLKLIEPE